MIKKEKISGIMPDDLDVEFIERQDKLSLISTTKIIAVITIISGLFALVFEVGYYKNVAMYVYIARFMAIAAAFWVTIFSFFDIGKKHPHILIHSLLVTIIISFASVAVFLPENLIVHSQITALIIFLSALFLNWEVKNQILVAIYYNIVFGLTLMMNKNGLLFFQNIFISVLFVMALSVVSIIAVAANYKLRKESLIKSARLISTEKKYQEIFENSVNGLFRMDLMGNVIESNKAFREILLGKDDKSLSTIQEAGIISIKNLTQLLSSIITNGEVENFQLKVNENKENEKICRLNCKVIKNKDNSARFIEGSIHDVTAQDKTEELLKMAKEKAERSDRMKSEFLAQISHEIRTPINSIIQAVDFLKEQVNVKQDSELPIVLDIVDTASKRIVRTIHLILNLAEVTSGEYEFKKSEIDFYHDCVKLLYNEFHPVAEQKGLKFVISKKTNDTNISVDEYSVKNIFHNILDNSIKFTEHGEIALCIDRNENGNLIIDISDTGVGISEEYFSNLYKVFSQEESGYTRKFDGNGLGLALAKKYCDLNNATIKIISQKNNGTKVRVTFN
jgi:PAS domain S-box-containing protein